MKKQSKLACTLLILCTTFAWTGCSDDDNPIRNTPTEDPTPAEPTNPDPHAGHRAEGFWIAPSNLSTGLTGQPMTGKPSA